VKVRAWAATSAALVALSCCCGFATGAAVSSGQRAGGSIYWGALAGGGQYGRADAPWDMKSVDRFQAIVHKKPSLLEWGQYWMDCGPRCGLQGFPVRLFDKVHARGAIPVVSWGSGSYRNSSPDQPAFRLTEITRGRYDAFIRQWAVAAKKWGHPFFLRFDWEMNGGFDAWGQGVNGNRPGDFAPMWRHVHDIFRRAGANNVTWVWCPNVVYPGDPPLDSRLFPGRAYVDWMGVDGYNWGTNPARGDTWRTFAEVFTTTYDRLLTLAPGKPIMIGETASSEFGGSKADWITDVLGTQLPQAFKGVKALVWFNRNADGMDWVLETSADAGKAFAAGIASPYYRSSGLPDPPPGPIPAP
jgi:hypothetical protein